MKIIVNKCYGGFGFSRKFIEAARERGAIWAQAPYTVLPGEAYSDGSIKEGYDFDSYNPAASEGDETCRTSPIAIRLLEEMGEEANGRFSNLKIVDIPFGIEWEIDDYDGMETIREKHRSW